MQKVGHNVERFAQSATAATAVGYHRRVLGSRWGMMQQQRLLGSTSTFESIWRREGYSIRAPYGPVTSSLQLHAHIRAASRLLRANDVQAGDRIIFCGDQSEAAFIWFWASVNVGAVFVPIDAATTLHQYRWACSKLVPRLMISEADQLDASMRSFDGGPPILPAFCYQGERDGMNQCDDAVDDAAIAVCLLTSGSTGEPKIVMISRRALAASAARVSTHFDWRAQEKLLNLAPPHTMSGLRNAFIAVPLSAMQWIVAPRSTRSDLTRLLELFGRVRAERIVAAPMLIRQINLLGDRVPSDLFDGVRALYCTGADLNPLEVSKFFARFKKPVINYYGLTESVGLCLTQDVQDWNPGDSSVGRAVDCELRVDQGELWVRQEFPMSGYFGDPASTAAVFHDGWLRTGDMANIDSSGRVHIIGRLGAFIKTTQTEKVSPLEVEAVLEQHHGVREAAVCGLPEHGGGERIAALLVTTDVAPSKELQREIRGWVAERLGNLRVPSVIRFALELPRTAGGKIERAKLPSYFGA